MTPYDICINSRRPSSSQGANPSQCRRSSQLREDWYTVMEHIVQLKNVVFIEFGEWYYTKMLWFNLCIFMPLLLQETNICIVLLWGWYDMVLWIGYAYWHTTDVHKVHYSIAGIDCKVMTSRPNKPSRARYWECSEKDL